MSKIVVIGGTGLIGSQLGAQLTEQGNQAVPASPNSGVNTLTGEGLAEVLAGAQVVVDVSNSPSFEEQAVLGLLHHFHHQRAGRGPRRRRWPFTSPFSVVGTQRLAESPYFRAKIAQEKLIVESGAAYSIVHATQFFEFVKSIADSATIDGTVHLSPALIQPIASVDVAAAVARVAVGAPLNAVVEVAGPEQFGLDELVRIGLELRQDPRPVVADPTARYFGAELETNTLLPGGAAQLSEIRFRDWSSAPVPTR